jgi:NADH-quinone oxidoreductase subunit N
MTASELYLPALAPLGFTAIAALGVLLLGVLGRRVGSEASAETDEQRLAASTRRGTVLAALASVALVLSVYAAASMFASGVESVFNPARSMLRMDTLSTLSIALIGLAALLCVWLSITYLPALHINYGEYYALLLLSTTGMFVVVSAVDFIALYVGLELMQLPLYALVGFDRRKLRSNEAALKYFVTGVVASAVLLYGMALVYGATGHTDFTGVVGGFRAGGVLAMAGLSLILVALAFKVAAFPFHQWAPDVYEGAPTSVTAFLAVAAKISAFVVLMRILALELPASEARLDALLWVLAAATMLVGNLMAAIQTNLKRLLAYSGIAHAGYLLVGLACGTSEGTEAVLFYLFIYLFMSLGAFGVLVTLSQGGRECESIDDLSGLATRRPGMAAALSLFLLALAGIPGTAGFMAKFHLFVAAVNADQIVLVIIAVFMSVMSFFYYMRLPIAMYMRPPSDAPAPEPSSSELLVVAVCVAAVLYFGFFPQSGPSGAGARALDLAAFVTHALP